MVSLVKLKLLSNLYNLFVISTGQIINGTRFIFAKTEICLKCLGLSTHYNIIGPILFPLQKQKYY